MQPKIRHSLQRKLIWVLVGAALLFSILAGSANVVRTYRLELQRSHRSFDNLATTVNSSASIAAFVGNETIAQDVCEALLKNPEILAVRIAGNRGFAFAQSKEGRDAVWRDEAVLVYPLYSPTNSNEQIGEIKLLTNDGLVASRARDAALDQLLVLTSLTALIAVILGFAFQRLIGSPLLKMTEQLRHIEPGNSQRLQIGKADADNEIGLVASSVNRYLEISETALRKERELLERITRIESHYRRILESTKVGIMVLDMNGEPVNCNSVVTNRSGHGIPAEPTDNPLDYMNQIFKYPKKAWALIERAQTSGNIASGDLELLNDDNEPRWAHCLFSIVSFSAEGINYVEVVFYDVTSRRKREENALRTAERDSLTDLVNRRGTLAYLERNLHDAKAEGSGLTLFFLDLDGFKQINDSYGHAAGDTVLREVARRLRSLRKRSSDLLGRLGGDEFVIAAYGVHKSDDAAHSMAQAVLDAIRIPILAEDGQRLQVGVSIGIAGYPENADEVATLIEAADQAMYEAKRRGKNDYWVAPTRTA